VALVHNNLAVLARVHHNYEHLAVADDGAARDEVAQAQNIVVVFLSVCLGDLQLAFEVVQVGVGQVALNRDLNLVFKVLLDLGLRLFDGQLGLEIAFSVQLGRLNKTFEAACFICNLEHNAVRGDLLFVFKDKNVADLYVPQTDFIVKALLINEAAQLLSRLAG
jgi:hypothetical protein